MLRRLRPRMSSVGELAIGSGILELVSQNAAERCCISLLQGSSPGLFNLNQGLAAFSLARGTRGGRHQGTKHHDPQRIFHARLLSGSFRTTHHTLDLMTRFARGSYPKMRLSK